MQVLTIEYKLFVTALLTVSCFGMSNGYAMGEHDKQLSAPCTYFGNPERTSARYKFVIEKPGHYCLTEDLHARIELADHPAEDTMIAIWSGDVVLDLQGHTLGRGRFFKNHGGIGIDIVDPDNFNRGAGLSKHIIIRNGLLQDFTTAVSFENRWPSTQIDAPSFNLKTNTYYFPANNITLENIIFRNNRENFKILVPPDSK